MKILAMLKRQRFEDNKSDETKQRRSKHQHLHNCDNEEGNGLDNEERNGLDKDEGEIKGYKYIPPPFIFQVSNRLLDLGKGTKSLKYNVYLLKICYLRSANFALELSNRRGSKPQKKNLY